MIVQRTRSLNPSSLGMLGLLLVAGSGCGEDPLPTGTNNFPSNPGGDGDWVPGDGDDYNPNPGDGDNGWPLPGNTSGIPCSLQTVIEQKCASCHNANLDFGASMPLLTREHFLAASPSDPSKKVYEAVGERINHTDPRVRMPPVAQPELTADELAALNAWVNSGAAVSSESCTPDSGDGDVGPGDGDGDGVPNEPSKCPNGKCEIDRTGLECYELRAHSGNKTGKYKVGTATDKYFNFHFKAPWTGTAYGIILRPIIDNTTVIHHWLLFQQKSGVTDGRIEGSNGTHPDGDLVHGWAPGGDMLNFRDIKDADVGLEFPQGDGFILEFHYNSKDANALDSSGVEVCVQKQKPVELAGVSWLGSDAIFGTSVSGTCAPKGNQPINILAVSPHMHIAGTHMKGIINRKDGSKETLHDGPFDFDNQTWYPRRAVLQPGDTITTTCTYNKFSTFGTATSAEMCYLFTVAYPKNALADGLPIGTDFHGAGSCLGW